MVERSRGLRPVLPAALALALGLTACGGGGGEDGGGEAGAASQRMVIATGVLPSVIDYDPESTDDGQSVGYLSRQMSGTLFAYNGAAENPDTAATPSPPEPELATGAEVSEDGLTWTVDLRPDVQSQWGNTLTSADVEWTFTRMFERNKTAATNTALINIDPADPITVVDEDTVEFHLTKPSNLFIDVLSVPSLAIFDSTAVKEKAGPDDPWGFEWLKTNSASFGPYQAGTNELPTRITLDANPNYWRGEASIKQVTFIAMAEPSTRLQAVLSGEVDYAPSMDAQSLDTLEESGTAKPYVQTATGINMSTTFVMNNPEVADPKLRRAMALAMDREAIISSGLNGVGTPATGCVVASLDPPTTDLDVSTTPEMDEAKELVSQISGNKTVSLGFVSTYPGGSTIPELLKRDWEAAGLTVNLVPYSSWTTFFADTSDGKFGVALSAFSPYVRDTNYVFQNLLTSDSGYNAGGWKNPEFDAAVTTAASALDEGEREAAVQTACDLVMEESPWAVIGLATGFTGINQRVTPFSAGSPIVYGMKLS